MTLSMVKLQRLFLGVNARLSGRPSGRRIKLDVASRSPTKSWQKLGTDGFSLVEFTWHHPDVKGSINSFDMRFLDRVIDTSRTICP